MGDYKLTACADYIYDSVDRGVTWTPESGSPNEIWTHIAGSSDGTTIIASTINPSKIYISQDSGATYINVNVMKNEEICRGLASSSDGKILYIGAESGSYEASVVSIYRSSDSGATWVKVFNNSDEGPHLDSMACSADGQTVIIVGSYAVPGFEFPFFYVSMDGGNLWKMVKVDLPKGDWINWNSVACSSDGKFIVAVSFNQQCIWTFRVQPDGQIVPTKQLNTQGELWYSVACSGSGSTVIASCITGLFISYNYGVDWVKKSSKSGGLECSNDGICMACTLENFIITSFDGGNTWIEQLGSYADTWRGIMITNKPLCVLGKTKILMADGSLKPIKDIVRGERVVTDKETGETKQVARVLSSFWKGKASCLPKGTLGGKEDVVCSEGHPVWALDGTYRMKSKDVNGAVQIDVCDTFYTLQYEEEGTYYAEGIRMDSVSPYFYQNRLPKQLYFNKAKHDKRVIVTKEDDPRRGKPKII